MDRAKQIHRCRLDWDFSLVRWMSKQELILAFVPSRADIRPFKYIMTNFTILAIILFWYYLTSTITILINLMYFISVSRLPSSFWLLNKLPYIWHCIPVMQFNVNVNGCWFGFTFVWSCVLWIIYDWTHCEHASFLVYCLTSPTYWYIQNVYV